MEASKFNEIIFALKKKLPEILPDDSRAVLFGSQARGVANDDSDWDIHILIPGNYALSREEVTKYALPIELLGYSFGECFEVYVYSHSDWSRRRFLPFYKNVENDKLILYSSLLHDPVT